jgi:arylsulfatase A-like enzyme
MIYASQFLTPESQSLHCDVEACSSCAFARRHRFIKLCSVIAAIASISPVFAGQPDPPRIRPNVLFIAIDDLNHWVRHLGRNDQAITPNIDRLASTGVTFTRAYCVAPACNPSRTALLSGLRPSTSGIYLNNQPWSPAIREGLTLPHHFQTNGYYTAGAGKIYHGSIRRSEWDEYMDGSPGKRPTGRFYKAGKLELGQLDCDDAAMPDYAIASYIIERLQRRHEKPFFLARGFIKPHLAWQVPAKYFNMHPLEEIRLPPIQKNDLDDVPPEGVKMAHAQRDHAAIVETGIWKQAIQAYLAAGTFVDAMVGRLLDALDASPYRDNTIVVLWGDHGWHLGE